MPRLIRSTPGFASSYAIDEAMITMKTILVPTEDGNAMRSALETALILARQCDSYIEGFALRWEIAEFTEADHREIARIEGAVPSDSHPRCTTVLEAVTMRPGEIEPRPTMEKMRHPA